MEVPEKSRDHAFEAASLYYVLGDTREAGRCMMLATLAAKRLKPATELEGFVQRGLQYALEASKRSLELFLYRELAEIAASKEDTQKAEQYRRWATQVEQADGLSPMDRWRSDVEVTEWIVSMAKNDGLQKVADTFEERLAALRVKPPTP